MNFPALIDRQPKSLRFTGALLLVLICGTIDWFSGYQVSMSLFYGAPILGAIWFCDRKSGLLIAVICGITWWWADVLAGHVYSRVWLSIWEPLARFVYFGFVAIGGAALKERHDAVQARIALLEHSQRLEHEIIGISEREQQRIGSDLHDGLCQYLAAISCAAGALRSDLLQLNLPQEAAVAEELTELLQNSVVQTRDLARGLVPVPVDEGGLPFALDGLANSVARLQNIDCKFHSDGRVKIDDPSAATHLYRIAQEAISNATRHGRADRIRIGLFATENLATLTIADNGRGFATAAGAAGMGLNLMRYRARLISGHLRVSAPNEGGTLLACTFPQKTARMMEDQVEAA